MLSCFRSGLSLSLAALLLAGPALHAQETSPAPQPVVAADAKPAPHAKGKEKKGPYTGPTTVVALPPTPMLDGEGKQRIDPDGKPMFNPPIRQQRDKKGHPLFDDKGKPVMQTAKALGYDEHGKKLHGEKARKIRTTPLIISRGVLTVDGLTGKAALNYDIADLKYIYIFAPGIGIAVVSNAPFPGAKEQPKAFSDKTLTVSADGHVLQLASDNRMLGKKPVSAFVLVDRETTLPSRFPVVGYGPTAKAPYMWPGAKPNAKLAGPVQAPPVPVDLLPVQLLKPCPAGQMRPATKVALPGEAAVAPPCVPIAKAVPVASTAKN